jgi:hypothetical protein
MNNFDRRLWQLRPRKYQFSDFKKVASVLVANLSQSIATGVTRIDHPLDAVQKEQHRKINDSLRDFVVYLSDLGVRSGIPWLPKAEEMGVPSEERSLILKAGEAVWRLEEHLQGNRPTTDASPIKSCHASLVEVDAKLSGESLQEVRVETPTVKQSPQILDTWYSPRQLAESAGVAKADIGRFVDRLRRPLREFRNNDLAGTNWRHFEDRGGRQSPFLYRGTAVQPIIEGLLRRT